MRLPQSGDDGLQGLLVPTVVGGLAEPQLPAHLRRLPGLHVAQPQQTVAEPLGPAEGNGGRRAKGFDRRAQELAQAFPGRLPGGRLQPQELGQGMALQMDGIVKVGQRVLDVMSELIPANQSGLQHALATCTAFAAAECR